MREVMGASAKSTSQAAVLLALLGLAAVALRGSLPGSDRTVNRPHPLSNTAALVLVVALLAVSLSIIAVATVSRIRNPPASASAAPVHVDSARGGAGRPGWRFWVIAAVGVAGALVLIHLLAQWDFSHPWSPAQSGPGQHGAPSGAAPIDAAPTAPPPTGTPTPADVTTLRVLSAAAVVFVALVAVGTLMTARPSRPEVSPAGAEWGGGAGALPGDAASQSLARAAELGLAQVGDPNREPRAAIIACYATMENELARVPGVAPRDFDTASEVLARAVEHDALRSDSATPLVELFEEARFSPHVMGEGHRDSAVQALRQVLAELRDAS
ncbi:MAG TPA: DUF4129 domain-containing protein [Gaiellales bacterium]|nr:DUF4129 domain-containing protein [Gaiellales bacterium]